MLILKGEVNRNRKVDPIYVCAGDTFNLSYTDHDGERHEVLSALITRSQVIDYWAIYEFTDQFDCESGYIGVFGTKKR